MLTGRYLNGIPSDSRIKTDCCKPTGTAYRKLQRLAGRTVECGGTCPY